MLDDPVGTYAIRRYVQNVVALEVQPNGSSQTRRARTKGDTMESR
jgi:hypothetical protein